MKSYIRRVAALSLIIYAFFFLFSACSRTANVKTIMKNIEDALTDYLSDSERVDNIEILKREVDKNAKRDIVLLRVETNDGDVTYVKRYRAVFQQIEKTGWVLASITPDQMDNWTSAPLKGVKESLIKDSVMGAIIRIDDDEWLIDEKNLENVTINSQETQLVQKKDTIIAKVELKDDVLVAEGLIQIDFLFDGSSWLLSEYRVFSPFTTIYKPHTRLELSNEEIILDIIKKEMVFGSGATEQLVSLSKNEISNFVLVNSTTQNKSTNKVYNCSFALNKGIVGFIVDTSIVYNYDIINGWRVSRVSFEPKVISADIEGEWKGRYSAGINYSTGANQEAMLVLNIIEVHSDGSISAIFNFSPSSTSSKGFQSGSYKMTGSIDYSDLGFALNGVEWIEQPGYYSYVNLRGYLHIETASLIKATGTDFEVSKRE